jgi:hypothetical protein
MNYKKNGQWTTLKQFTTESIRMAVFFYKKNKLI